MFAGKWMVGYNYLIPDNIGLRFEIKRNSTWNCDGKFKFEIVYHKNTSNETILTYKIATKYFMT